MKKGYSWLNSKEVKKLKESLNKTYGCEFDFSKYAICINERKKYYMINRDIDRIDLEQVRINNIGLYFGEQYDEGIRLSIESSQLIGPVATKNIVELDDVKTALWLRGNEIEFPGRHDGFVLVKRGPDFLGCAKHKEDKLLNFVPKERRIKSID